jgi:NitT/TauT family transport system permease protein
MTQEETKTPGSLPVPKAERTPAEAPRVRRQWFVLRAPAPRWQVALLGALCIAMCFGIWWFVTRGEAEQRILGPAVLPSPGETFRSLHSLWFDRALTRNVFVTLRRVVLGFALAAVIGVPLGVICGCFSRVAAFFAPLTLVGRNIPIAALIPLTFSLFGIGEKQKVMFIFIACVAFVISDTARAIADVGAQYVDTAYTLGARRRQIVLKVLVPLAMPTVFNSLRLLFGLAFGYIMLAELVKLGGEAGGLGDIIIMSQRRGQREHILLVLMIIPLVALALDRILFLFQRELFPHRYGGFGLLNKALRAVLHRWEDFKGLFWSAPPAPEHQPTTSGDAK